MPRFRNVEEKAEAFERAGFTHVDDPSIYRVPEIAFYMRKDINKDPVRIINVIIQKDGTTENIFYLRNEGNFNAKKTVVNTCRKTPYGIEPVSTRSDLQKEKRF
jgi:hypothetical protein